MENFTSSKIYQLLVSRKRHDLIERVQKLDWYVIDDIKKAYYEELSEKTDFEIDEIISVIEMELLPIKNAMNIIPKTVGHARDLLMMISLEAESDDQMLIQKILRMTDEESSDIDILQGMSAVALISESNEKYASIVVECGNFIVESMSFLDDSIDLKLGADQIDKINI